MTNPVSKSNNRIRISLNNSVGNGSSTVLPQAVSDHNIILSHLPSSGTSTPKKKRLGMIPTKENESDIVTTKKRKKVSADTTASVAQLRTSSPVKQGQNNHSCVSLSSESAADAALRQNHQAHTTNNNTNKKTRISSSSSSIVKGGKSHSLPPLTESFISRLKQQNKPIEFNINEECTSIDISPTGSYIIGGFSDGTVRFFNLGSADKPPNKSGNNSNKNLEGKSCNDEDDDDSEAEFSLSNDEDDGVIEQDHGGAGEENSSISSSLLSAPLSKLFSPNDSDTSKLEQSVANINKRSIEVCSRKNQAYGSVATQIHAKGTHTSLIMHVAFTQDCKFAFAGVMRGSTEMVALDMSQAEQYFSSRMNYNNDSKKKKEANLSILDLITVYKTSDMKLRGFGACARWGDEYRLFCGRGIKNVHIWSFKPPSSTNPNPVWSCIHDTQSNGNTISFLRFRMLPSGNLQGISKSAGCKIRLWDLSTESGERPPYKDIENSEQSLAAFGPYALGGSFNEVHVVNLDSKTSICNRMEFHLPGADTGGRGRRRRGDLKSVTDVIGINSGTEALLEISDGSIVHFSNSDESKSAHQYLRILEPKLYQPWPVTPDVPVTRKLAISRIGQQGYLVIAASQYSQSSGRGKLILSGLSGSKPHDKESWGYWDPKIQTHHQTQISGLQQQQPPRSVNVPTHPLHMTDTASVISWPSPISHTSFSVNTMSPPHQQQRSSMIMNLNNSNKKMKKQRREQMMIPTDDFHEHESKKLVQKYLHEAQKKAETKTKKSSRDNVMDNKTEKKKLKISIASKQALMSEEKKKKSSSSTQNPPMISTKTKSQQKKLDATLICEKEHEKMRRRYIIAKTKNSSEVSKEESFSLAKPSSAGKMNKSKVEKMDNNKHGKPSSIDGTRKISDGEKPSHKKRRLSKSPQRERPVDASAWGTIGTANKLTKRRLLEEHKKKLSLPSIPRIRKCISDERIHKEKKTSALTSDSDVGMTEEKTDKKLKAKSGNKKDRGEEKPTVFLRRSISGNGDDKRLKSPSRDRLQVKSQIAKNPEGESILKDKKTSKHISSPIPTLAKSKEKKSLSHRGRSKSPEPSHFKNDLTRNTSSIQRTNPSDPQQKSDYPKISTIIESNIQLYGDPSENTIAVLSLLSRSNNRNKNNSNNASTTESSVNQSIKHMEQRREMALQFRSAHNVLRQKFLSTLSFVKTNLGDGCMLKKGHAQKVETTILDYESMKNEMIERQYLEATSLAAMQQQESNGRDGQVPVLSVSFPFPKMFDVARSILLKAASSD